MGETKDQVTSQVRKRPSHKVSAEAPPEAPEAKLEVLRDLPHRYRQSPGIYLLAAALGGGLLVALATHRRRSSAVRVPPRVDQARNPANGAGARTLAFEAIKGALIGVAASEAKSVFLQMMSGVTRHLTARAKPKQSGAQRRVRTAQGST